MRKQKNKLHIAFKYFSKSYQNAVSWVENGMRKYFFKKHLFEVLLKDTRDTTIVFHFVDILIYGFGIWRWKIEFSKKAWDFLALKNFQSFRLGLWIFFHSKISTLFLEGFLCWNKAFKTFQVFNINALQLIILWTQGSRSKLRPYKSFKLKADAFGVSLENPKQRHFINIYGISAILNRIV